MRRRNDPRAQQPAPDQGLPIDYHPVLISYLAMGNGIVHQVNGSTNLLADYGVGGAVSMVPLALLQVATGSKALLGTKRAPPSRAQESATSPRTEGLDEPNLLPASCACG